MDPVAKRRLAFAQELVRQAEPLLPEDGSELRDRLLAAFASVPREAFLGPPPWRMHRGGEHADGVELVHEPEDVYRDRTIALAPERGINNGQPSLHARCLAALAPHPGEAVVHVGAGTGYYTAILAELVGAEGRVDAYEIETDLAWSAARNLVRYPWARVRPRSGAEAPLPACDAIYVNAGASRPLPAWLDALRPHGRLLFPLTTGSGAGAMLLLVRPQGEESAWPAWFLDPVVFIGCMGGQEAGTGARLARALAGKDLHRVRSFHRKTSHRETSPGRTPPRDGAWLAGDGWWLSVTPP